MQRLIVAQSNDNLGKAQGSDSFAQQAVANNRANMQKYKEKRSSGTMKQSLTFDNKANVQ